MSARQPAVIAIGRFNPPTIGHYALIEQMKRYISGHSKMDLAVTPIIVLIRGEKTDPEKNPLTAEESIKFMEASGKANAVKFLTAKNAFDAFLAVRNVGFEPLVIAAGSDRADDYVRLLDSNFKTDDDKPIKHFKLELVRGSGDGISVKTASATAARALVTHGHFDEFQKISGLNPGLAQKLFDLLKSRLKHGNN